MKTSSVSTLSLSQSLRHSLLRNQSELAKAQKEATTGRVADVGLALGARAARSVSFARDMERLGTIIDSNALAASRLSSTQDALGQMADVAQGFLKTLTASTSGSVPATVTLTDARATLEALTAILNTAFSGEYLFAGINTDVTPVNDFDAPASPAKAAFDAAFLAHFGFAQSDPAAQNITAGQMDAFLTAVEPQFLGAGWQANWSNASDQGIVSRIALNETAETSANANELGIRKLAMAAATIMDLFSGEVGDEARNALVSRAVSLVGESLADIASLQSRLGITETRVKNASERLTMQVDLFERHILDLESVDPYEASTRVSTLLSQIETSYALTARIQQLSLTRFLI